MGPLQHALPFRTRDPLWLTVPTGPARRARFARRRVTSPAYARRSWDERGIHGDVQGLAEAEQRF